MRKTQGKLEEILNGSVLGWVGAGVAILNANTSNMQLFSSKKIAY